MSIIGVPNLKEIEACEKVISMIFVILCEEEKLAIFRNNAQEQIIGK